MTLHLIPLNFLIYVENSIFFFISVLVQIPKTPSCGNIFPSTQRTFQIYNIENTLNSPGVCSLLAADKQENVSGHSAHIRPLQGGGGRVSHKSGPSTASACTHFCMYIVQACSRYSFSAELGTGGSGRIQPASQVLNVQILHCSSQIQVQSSFQYSRRNILKIHCTLYSVQACSDQVPILLAVQTIYRQPLTEFKPLIETGYADSGNQATQPHMLDSSLCPISSHSGWT